MSNFYINGLTGSRVFNLSFKVNSNWDHNNIYTFSVTGQTLSLNGPLNSPSINSLSLPPGIIASGGIDSPNTSTSVTVTFSGTFTQIGNYSIVLMSSTDGDPISITATINITITEDLIYETEKILKEIECQNGKLLKIINKKINVIFLIISVVVILWLIHFFKPYPDKMIKNVYRDRPYILNRRTEKLKRK